MILAGEAPHYEIQKIEGEGLTGTVYQAYRWDSRRLAKQKVAIKLIKSENDVPILRREFERLQGLSSDYCVRLLAWENIHGKPALVLEYICGVSLSELLKAGSLPRFLCDEICAQIQEGLKDIRDHGSVHGDLSPHNILISTEGEIKLIDFGSLDPRGALLAHKEYVAPELSRSGEPTFQSDLFSLGVIRQQLLGEDVEKRELNSLTSENPQLRRLINLQPKKGAQRKLGHHVRRFRTQKALSQKTSRIVPLVTRPMSTKKLVSRRKKLMAWAVGWLLVMGWPESESTMATTGTLTVRAQKWSQVSLNGLPSQFTPIRFPKLRPGVYHVRWRQTGNGREKLKRVRISENQSQWLQID